MGMAGICWYGPAWTFCPKQLTYHQQTLKALPMGMAGTGGWICKGSWLKSLMKFYQQCINIIQYLHTYIYIHLARITYPNKLLMYLRRLCINMIVWLWQKNWHVQAVSTHRTSAEAASKPTVSSAVTCREPSEFMRKACVNAGHCC